MNCSDSVPQPASKQGKGDLPGQLRLFDPEAEPIVEIKVEPGVVGATLVVEPAAATKRCGRCKCEKTVGEFAKHCRRKDGLNHRCRVCDAEYHAERARNLKAGETVARNRELPRGVDKVRNRYRARYRDRTIGTFPTIAEAAAAYTAATVKDPVGVPTSAYQVDAVFAEAVSARNWRFIDRRYLATSGIAGDSFSHVLQHIFVWRLAGGLIPDGLMLDHINHDRTDNRLANLRLISVKGNNLNRRKPTSPYLRPGGRWQAKVAHKTLGTFGTREQAQAVINAHVAGLIEQETVMHGADLLASYLAKQPTPVG